ncbi:SRPBCC family protein [Actinomycetospora callitridis]|uniref:SRPBCC family protein n=1 Tax=Actinomycetospora callitridis TaxID=913944 RepID=UPI00236508B2|nr:SRPBCC family protein [Actinomycetospora callitridis]MDD7921394.1 SRPBCC family protein [Actinomycetospora callitridis]
MQTTLRATGPLPADQAWERYADLDRWPRWAPQISGVTVSGSGPRRLCPGLEGTVRAAGLVHVPFEVLAVDEQARTWSWRVRVGPVTLTLDHGIEDLGAGRTRTWLRTTGPALVVLPYSPVAFVALHALLLER